MKTFPNNYPGTCVTCKEQVTARGGLCKRWKGRWIVFHHECNKVRVRKPKPVAQPSQATFPPVSEADYRIARSILYLAALDTDRARLRNGVGFNKFDSRRGHQLARYLRESGRLTRTEWNIARAFVKKYRRQLAA